MKKLQSIPLLIISFSVLIIGTMTSVTRATTVYANTQQSALPAGSQQANTGQNSQTQSSGTIDDAKNEVCEGAMFGSAQNCSTNSPTLTNLIKKLINVASVIIGMLAVLMLIYAGFRYITSGGEASDIAAAKNTMLYAIVGIIIVALSQFIVQFVIENITKS